MSKDQGVPAGAMPSAEPQGSAEAASLVSTLDILALAALGLAGLYFLILRHRKKRDQLNTLQSYTITPSTMTTTDTACFIDKMLTSGKNMLVVYGSQTGTAEEFATRIAKECRRYGMKGLVADPEECNMQDLPRLVEIKKHLVVFLMATYGEGDPTDNAQEFYEWIKEEEAADLTGINYTVFALGNKTYEHFNAAGKLVDRRMSELGATRIFELGLGDDDANIEEDFLSWKERMLPYAKEFLGFEDSGEEEKRQYELKVLEDVVEDAVFTGELSRLRAFTKQRPPFDAKNPFLAPLRVNRRLQKSGDRELMHLELDISGSRIRYEAGDHVAVYPVNDATLVDKLGELLNTDLDTIISLTAIDPDTAKKHPFPCPTRYRTALSHYLDITSVPKHFLLRELLDFTTGEEDRANLTLMSSNTEEGRAAYHTWVVEACRNIVHLLEDLPSCRPPLDLLCELLPRLQPRYYSISSSSKVHPECVHITCVLVRYNTTTGRENRGVATWWLLNHAVSEQLQQSAPAGDDAQQLQLPIPRHLTVPCFVRKSQFRLPVKTTTPIILVGPGTGLAPMRGFIQERAYQRQQGKEVGDTWLFYGCRRKEEDYMYQEELEQFEKEGVIKLVLAFSRDQADKVYVTHRLREHAAALWRLIDAQRAHIYVCGDAKVMARDVNTLLHDVCRQQGNMNELDADQYVKKMRTQKRYSEDVWS